MSGLRAIVIAQDVLPAGYNLVIDISGTEYQLMRLAQPPVIGMGDIPWVHQVIRKIKYALGLHLKNNTLDVFAEGDLPELEYHDDLAAMTKALGYLRPLLVDNMVESVGRRTVDEDLRDKLIQLTGDVARVQVARFNIVPGNQRRIAGELEKGIASSYWRATSKSLCAYR
ncbi:hypothetical protein HY489_00990 [Candidatus Woesearchaeota archaeon]|nr:hypothetical protein [Candidatus Woesearchaeota archaeon]